MLWKSQVLFIFALINAVACIVITPQGQFITSCFTDEDPDECDYSRVKICGDFYACDMAIHFPTPIKRIGYIDDNILVTEGSNTHLVDKETFQSHVIKKIIPPWGEFIDRQGNKYYVGDGTTYVGVNDTGLEVEIVTTGEYSSNQIVLDVDANRLFILTFMKADKKDDRSGYLFAVTLDPLNIVDGKIQAEKVDGDDSITAMAIQGSLQKLLLGTKTSNGQGKLIRLNRLKSDPCAVPETHQTSIHDVVKDAEVKLVKIFEDSDALAKKNCLELKNSIEISTKASSELEILKLRRQLNTTTSKLNACTFRVFEMNISESSSSSVSIRTEEVKTPCISQKNSHNHDDYQYSYHHTHEKQKCLFIPEFDCLQNRIRELETSEIKLKSDLEFYVRSFGDFVKDPLLENEFNVYTENRQKSFN